MRGDEEKSREELVEELTRMRRRLAALEGSEGTREPAEDAPQGSEDRYRLLVEGARDYAIFTVGPDGRVADRNLGAERLFGYREEEIVGEPSSVLFTPEDVGRGAHEAEVRKAEAEGRAEDERWHARKDGSRFWTSGVVTPVRDGSGALRGFAKVARDATERKRSEEEIGRLNEGLEERVAERTAELEAERARLEAVLRQMPSGVVVAEAPSGRLVLGNEQVERIFRRPFLEAADVGRYERYRGFHPEDGRPYEPEEWPLARTVRTGEEVEDEEIDFERGDGTRGTMLVSSSPIRNGEGRVVAGVAIFHDVTERKRSEEALRRQAELLELSLEPIFAWELRGDGIVYWNRGAEELYGFSREEVLGSESHRLLRTVHPAPLEEVEAELEREGRWEGELVHTTRDGREVVVESCQALAETSDGRRLVLETNRDVTGRRQAEEALDAIREAERRRISRDLHDVVLQDLSGALQGLQLARLRAASSGPAPEDLGEQVEALRRAAAGLRGAVYDLRLRRERPFVYAVEDLVESERRANPEREVGLSVGEGFPEGLPEAAGVELLRVVREALANARRHSGAGRVGVVLGADGGRARVEVADDGLGFAPGESPETPRGGVGLSAMRERVEALGGELQIRSSPGGARA